MALTEALRKRREEIVIEHMESENRHEFDVTIETFHHPRYELVATGDVFDGREAVERYFEETRTAFPDQRNELIELTHHDDGTVVIEFWLRGTHLGGDRATGRSFEVRLWAAFDFDADDLMTSERVFTSPPTVDQIAGRVTPDGRPVAAPA
jgi:ketosteroid isomerase-like protein